MYIYNNKVQYVYIELISRINFFQIYIKHLLTDTANIYLSVFSIQLFTNYLNLFYLITVIQKLD